MATSQQKRKNRKQILILLLAVILVVAVSLGFQYWWNNRPETPPSELAITVETSDGQTMDLYPYLICEAGEECDAPDEVTTIKVPDDASVTLTIPSEIYDHDWTLLQIYDDPALNDEFYYAANERTEVKLDVTISAQEKGADEADAATETDAQADATAGGSTATTSGVPSSTESRTEADTQDTADTSDTSNVDAGSSDTSRLVVVEINSLQIDHDADGNEIPVTSTWSIAFEES
ncbi:MAG: DUF2771 domain-containing protein [Corynebacterium sp.]|nr:DUF2771 domain-containing protein [Corynebacterium sp.]